MDITLLCCYLDFIPIVFLDFDIKGKSVDADTLIDVLSEVSDGNDDVSTESDDDDELLTLEAASPQPQPLSVTGLSEDTYIPKSTVLSSDLPSTSSSSSSPFIKENHQEKSECPLRLPSV